MPKLNFAKQKTHIIYVYDLPRRSSLSLLKKLSPTVPITNNYKGAKQEQALMYLKSPKHFKTSKQIIFFYNRKLKLDYFYSFSGLSFILKPSTNLFSFFKGYGPKLYNNEISLSRISIKTKVLVNFNGWCFIFPC